jgi:predicted patatin/cPLA2 family phospholipase
MIAMNQSYVTLKEQIKVINTATEVAAEVARKNKSLDVNNLIEKAKKLQASFQKVSAAN